MSTAEPETCTECAADEDRSAELDRQEAETPPWTGPGWPPGWQNIGFTQDGPRA